MIRPTILLTVLGAVLVGGVGPASAADPPGDIPAGVLLHSDDVGGAAVVPGGPDGLPLPAWPCGARPGPDPQAERSVNAAFGRYHAYGYVARYPGGQARSVVDDLRGQLARCPRPAEGERYRVLSEDTAGVLFTREFRDGDGYSSYYVGFTEDYLVAVLETGAGGLNGDPTTASDLGSKALARAGGTRGTPGPPPPPTDRCDSSWVLAAMERMDVPRNSARDVEGCDGSRLVMTVDVNSTACGAGGRPGCSAPPDVARYFLRFDEGWHVFARTRAAGCAAAVAVEPEFPRALCADLPATG